MQPDFKPFNKIEKLNGINLSITQKLHGTNAFVIIVKGENDEKELYCGSRTRFIYPHDDNYGFANFVHQHKEEFIEKLGCGRHDGEWCGPGINSGEGLKEKTFVLFDYFRYPPGRPLPPQTTVVPVLYDGPCDDSKIIDCMEKLKEDGSFLVPGFMRAEGIVAKINGTRYKKSFSPEDTQWTKPSSVKVKIVKNFNFDHICQPIRLEKLLSKDERLVTQYPISLPEIVRLYMTDLIEEGEIKGSEDEINSVRKGAASQIFGFVKSFVSLRMP